jgi:hypothetical protein
VTGYWRATLLTEPGVASSVGRSMAKARPLRKAGRKTGAKSVKNRRGPSAELKRPTAKRAATKRPVKPPIRAAARAPVSPSPIRRKATVVAERQTVNPEIPPPLPAPIASFTF